MSGAVPPTTAIADVLFANGMDGWLVPPLCAMGTPVSRAYGAALTVLVAPKPRMDRGALEPLYEVLSGDLNGRVLVIGGAEGVQGAVWGQILSRAAARAKACGALVGGAVRDCAVLSEEGIPVWGLHAATVGAVGMAQVVGIGVPVHIGSVTVEDEDLIVCDVGGVVRVPRGVVPVLLQAARELADAESRVLAALSSGHTLADAYTHKRSARTRLGLDKIAAATVASKGDA